MSVQVPMLPSFDKNKKTERSFICSHYIIDRNFSFFIRFHLPEREEKAGTDNIMKVQVEVIIIDI